MKLAAQRQALAFVAAAVVAIFGKAQAEPVRFAAVITPKADATLNFADGSQRAVRLVQREGKVTGDAPVAGATLLEWGLHDLAPQAGGGDGLGYLVLTQPSGDIAYLRFQWRAVLGTGADDKPQPLIGGHWEVVGSTGKLRGLTGMGTMRINILSPTERQWLFEGDLLQSVR
jgi:hypothetical protein